MHPPAGSAAGCCPARRAGLRRAWGTAFRYGQGWSQVLVGHVDGLNREHSLMRQACSTVSAQSVSRNYATSTTSSPTPPGAEYDRRYGRFSRRIRYPQSGGCARHGP